MGLASVAIQVLPMDKGKDEVVAIVDEAIAYIKGFGLNTTVGPFETTVEGDYEILMEIVTGVSQIALKAGAGEVMTYVKICVAQGDVLTIEKKTAKHQD